MTFEKTLTLVTGGAGFIGSHIVDALVLAGADVTVADDLSTGHIDNIADHVAAGRIEFIEADICDLPPIEASLIFNLACPASPRSYQSDPIRTWRTSVVGGERVALLARDQNARLIHLSTSEVYGDPLLHPQREDQWGNVNPIGPRACYDEGKRALECLLMDMHRMYGLDVRIARVFNTYGPRMQPNDGRAIPTFLRQALAGEALTIEGNGDQTRSFCYVDDLIVGIMAMAQSSIATGEVINLGNPTERSIRELCETIGRIVPIPGIAHIAAAPDDPSRRCPDIGKAKALLGWSPQIDLETGLRRMIAANQSAAA